MAFVTAKQYAELEQRVAELEARLGMNEVPTVDQVLSLEQVYGDELALTLSGGGFKTPEQVKNASDEDLLAVSGIGPATLAKIRGKE